MQDFVPLGTGNSRSLKSAVPAGTTWEQALAMLRNGTFPIDIGAVNEAGVSQKGTPLNRANLLSDATVQLFGSNLIETDTGNPTPDDALKSLIMTLYYGTIPKYTLLNSTVTDGTSIVIDISGIDFNKRHFITFESESAFSGYVTGVSNGSLSANSRNLTFSISNTVTSYVSGLGASIALKRLNQHVIELACYPNTNGGNPYGIKMFHKISDWNDNFFEAYSTMAQDLSIGINQIHLSGFSSGVTVKFYRRETP